MAWYTYTYSCGHEAERLQLYGPGDGRRSKIAQLARHACPECREAAATAADAAAGLVPLIGTPAQIAWASEIRERALRLVSTEQRARILSESRASWWIDRRNDLDRLTTVRG